MKSVAALLLFSLASCSNGPSSQPLCSVAKEPEAHVGSALRISGLARMARHGSSLSDPTCPDSLLALEASDTPESTRFFNLLAGTLAPNQSPIPVTVVGQVVRHSGADSYAFRVSTGATR